jgi:hypothetical protein
MLLPAILVFLSIVRGEARKGPVMRQEEACTGVNVLGKKMKTLDSELCTSFG